MKNRNAFRPDSLAPLEDRVVPSTMAAHVANPSAIRASRSTADRVTTQFENNFLTGMIPHHQMAIRMSRIALRNSDDSEVRDLARRIIGAQRPEIQRMQRFLAHNGVRGYRPPITPDERAVLGELRSMQDGDFDRAFLTEMTGHHRMAISGDDTMEGAAECTGRAAQPGLLRLCSDIVETQADEIEEMGMILTRLGGSLPDDGGPGGHGG